MGKTKRRQRQVKKKPDRIIRTDKWILAPTSSQKILFERTISEYRRLVKALTGVVLVHWTFIKDANDLIMAVEHLMHRTAKRPKVKYSYFNESFHKFPSYLRRAAIEAAVGQVSSLLTRYYEWQGGIRSRRDACPPKFNPNLGVYPNLYQGQSIKFNDDCSECEIKVFTGSDWIWTTVLITKKRNRHLVPKNERLSPALIFNNKSCHLSVPFKCNPDSRHEKELIVAVDLGLNTTATVSVVASDGTVMLRRFIHPGRDSRDKRLKHISRKARRTMGYKGKLNKGFCKGNYRKATNINQEISQKVSNEIVGVAVEFGAQVIVFENLFGWRPKGGRKRSTLRQRYHGWLHRRLVELTEMKWSELGGTVEYVNPAYTSKHAYDGSGLLSRSSENYALATFSNGKRYNADLNASYNIAARYLYKKSKLRSRNDSEVWASKSSALSPRIPVTLSLLWVSSQQHCRVDTPLTTRLGLRGEDSFKDKEIHNFTA